MNSSRGLVLAGGTIVDGTGSPSFVGDVIIQGDRIRAVARRDASQDIGSEWKFVDCSGYVVAPGFIDAHSHSDLHVLTNQTEKVLQGVTTEVVGNCGFSAYPAPNQPNVLREFANGILAGDDNWCFRSATEYLESASKSKTATVASLVGHGALRIKVAGNTCRELTQAELHAMIGLLEDALAQGAAGFSSGLMYAPGSGASAAELEALCRVVARMGGVYATHMRNYSSELVPAVIEQIEIAEATGCRLQISHLQAVGEANWPLQERAITAIEQASARGVDVAFDSYPWIAGATVLTQLLPQSALDGGMQRLLVRLREPDVRDAIARALQEEQGDRWRDLVISAAAHDPESLVGRTLEDIAAERGIPPSEAVLDILLEQDGNANILEYNQSVVNLRSLLTHPLALVVTDGVYTSGRPHPRLFGTFPLLLGDMVRERKWFTMEEAVHKVTGKPASTFHLRDRGKIADGYIADITVFDADAIRTDASYEVPAVAPKGIRSVYRNGALVVNEGKIVYA